ncbi:MULTISPECIES: ATP-binding protein [Chitinophaga]|uniref:histidine kinase n=1 Tax=Chitinophaga chungangae TaxID=2821488 RepID=A0ABS3YB15_9BACT|nr:ATP-binding protein [Chitinophaga chungangae]MBO9151849.1 response regulator [Chitinophaga chungangae]
MSNRNHFLRYLLIACLVITLVSIVLAVYVRQQRSAGLGNAIHQLSYAGKQMEWIDHAVVTMYAAENHFRYFTLTYANEHFNSYSNALQQVAADLDSLEAHHRREKDLGGMLKDVERKSNLFLQVKQGMDSLLVHRVSWDTTAAHNAFAQMPNFRFSQKIQIDTIDTGAKNVKRKKLLGRLADAIAPKKNKTDTVRSVRTVHTVESAATSREQMEQIHAYYNNLYKKIAQGQVNLNNSELNMITSSDRLLKALQADLVLLKEQERIATAHKKEILAANIGHMLEGLDRATLRGVWLIGLLTLLILFLLWFDYRKGRQLQKAKQSAERYSKLKSDFVASMSHEIRTPLNSVIGFSEQMAKTKMDREQEEIMNAINLSAGVLLSIVNNVLDFSALEQGKLALDTAVFSPRKAIEDTIKGMQIQASRKRLDLIADIRFTREAMVEGDAFRLKQVLFNIIGNAIKFTNEGGVKVSADLQVLNGKSMLKISVADTGIGIDPKHLPHIFDEFTQVPGAKGTSGRHEGSGLGLTIVRKIVELHGSTLEVDSVPGKGTTFRFTLPYKSASNTIIIHPQQAARPKPRQSHVLVVDDNNLNRRLLEMILERLNITFISAGNGVEALELMAKHHFDAVLTDIQMPEMDGLALARHIRGLGDPKKSTLPILAITGNVVKEDLETYMSAGIDGYVLKPFKEAEILEKLRAIHPVEK